MATAKKTATKKAAKKAVKKTATKRAYNRKPKPEVKAEDVSVMAAQPVTEAYAEPTPQESPTLVQLTEYSLWDMRDLPLLVRAAFLIELESLGYVYSFSLKAPSEGTGLSNLQLVEIVKLNHVNKLITFVQFAELRLADGLIAMPQYLENRLDIMSVRTSTAAPAELILQGERFVRA